MAGVVAALSMEARTLGSPARRSDGLWSVGESIVVAVSGIGCAAAATAAQALAEAGATALVSWGMAGGLDPSLDAGTLCVPSAVISPQGATFATDRRWCELLTAALAGAARAGRHSVVGGTLLTSSRTIDDVIGKAAAFRETGAVAVDMESAAIALIAASHGLPFIAVRAVVDTASDRLPEAVLTASSGGRVHITRLLVGIARAPRQIAPLLRLAQRYRAATRALAAVARCGALSQRS